MGLKLDADWWGTWRLWRRTSPKSEIRWDSLFNGDQLFVGDAFCWRKLILLHEANQPVVDSFQLTSLLRSSNLICFIIQFGEMWDHLSSINGSMAQDIGWIPSWKRETGPKLKRHQIALQRSKMLFKVYRYLRELYSRYYWGVVWHWILWLPYSCQRESKSLQLLYGRLPWVGGLEGFANGLDPLERLATKDEIIHRQDC